MGRLLQRLWYVDLNSPVRQSPSGRRKCSRRLPLGVRMLAKRAAVSAARSSGSKNGLKTHPLSGAGPVQSARNRSTIEIPPGTRGTNTDSASARSAGGIERTRFRTESRNAANATGAQLPSIEPRRKPPNLVQELDALRKQLRCPDSLSDQNPMRLLAPDCGGTQVQ